MNAVFLMGRLTTDPLTKDGQDGKKQFAKFNIAVERSFQKPGTEKLVDYIPVIAWDIHANFVAKWLKKGMRVAITGELRQNVYSDKDGKPVHALNVVASKIEFADGKSQAPERKENVPDYAKENDFMSVSGDDNPFT